MTITPVQLSPNSSTEESLLAKIPEIFSSLELDAQRLTERALRDKQLLDEKLSSRAIPLPPHLIQETKKCEQEGRQLQGRLETFSKECKTFLEETEPGEPSLINTVVTHMLQHTALLSHFMTITQANNSKMLQFTAKCDQIGDRLRLAEASELAYNKLCKEEEAILSKQKKKKAKQQQKIAKDGKAALYLQESAKDSPTVLQPLPVVPQCTIPAPPSPPLSLECLRSIQCRDWIKGSHYSFDFRVRRWWTDDLTKIPDFADRDHSKKIVCKYKNYTPEKCLEMKDYHDLRGAEKFIDNKIYRFFTKTGVGLACSLTRDGAEPRFGFLYFGLDQGCIYHMCFKEEDTTALEDLNVFEGPPLDAPLKKDIKAGWDLQGAYQVTVDTMGVVTILYPNRGLSLQIYPLRKDLLPRAIFSHKSATQPIKV